MRKTLAAQRAKARQRLQRAKADRPARSANDNVVELAEPLAPEPLAPEPLALVESDIDEEEAPFAPPPADDIMGLGEIDEAETIFVAPAPVAEAAPQAPAQVIDAPESEDPPFDPPEAEDLAPANDDEEDVPFDPPTEADEIFQTFEREEAPAPAPEPLVLSEAPPKTIGGAPRIAPARCDRPLPPISLHLAWDRPATAELFLALAKERRFANARVTFGRGGLDAAAQRFAAEASPDLLVLDTTLKSAGEILAALDRLAEVLAPETHVVVIGAVNDVTLLRELSHRGVSDYIMWPAPADDVASALCRLYADTDKSRVIAVIGARGGVGASTIAMNLAWFIAERHHAATALLDLDLAFGAASYAAKESAEFSIADAFARLDAIDDTLDRTAIERTPRLRIFSAPAAVERALEPEPEALQAVIAHARRMSAFVVLDLPHAWNAWIKQALLGADDIVIVAGPDLASLRNADNMLKLLRSEPGLVSSPLVTLSMVGVPKRPEIPLKDFAEALTIAPSAAFAFDPALYAGAAMAGQSIYEAAPGSKAARALDALASQLTGREPLEPPTAAPAALPTLAELGIETKDSEAPAPTKPDAEPEDAEISAVAKPTETPVAPEAPREAVKVDDLPPLELVTEAPLELVTPLPPAGDRFAAARKAAEAELAALQRARKPVKPRRKSSGLLRAAASIALTISLGAWYLQNQRVTTTTAAAEPPRAAAAIAPAPQPVPRAAEMPTPPYIQALALIGAGDTARGLAELHRLAEEGSALAQYRLAKFYERGEHVEADTAAARSWTQRAAEGGNVRAMHDLGVYFAREGAERDDAAAFRWFRQAAEYGFADSQFNLGVVYLDGRGVTADPAEALFWFLLAARGGDAEAGARAAALEADLLATEIEQARARAMFFNQRAPNPAANLVESPSAPPA